MTDLPLQPTAIVLHQDCRQLPLADNSVDLVVTSPPYFALRSYQDAGEHYEGQIGSEPTAAEFVDSLLAVTKECTRVLKSSGSLWVNLGDKYVADNRGSGTDTKRMDAKWAPRGDLGYVGREVAPRKSLMGLPWRYALRCIDELGLILRAEVIWSKPNGLPESVTDRVRRSHEQWFHFTIEPRYFSAIDEIREPAVRTDPRASGRRYSAGVTPGDGTGHTGLASAPNHPKGSLPSSVWTVPTEPLKVPAELGVDHFAAFPTEWPRRIISAFCPEGGVVLDPFGGTGTTALVATVLGRHAVSADMSADYCRLAEWRINDPKQRERVLNMHRYGVRNPTKKQIREHEAAAASPDSRLAGGPSQATPAS